MLHTPALSRSSFWFKIAISAVLVGLADLLFFKHAPGTSLGLFAFVVLGGVLFQSKGPAAGSPSVVLHPRRSRLLPCGGGSPWSAGLGAVRRFNKRRRLVEPSWAERNSIGLDPQAGVKLVFALSGPWASTTPSPALVTGLYQPGQGRTQSGLTPSTFAGED